MKYKFNEKETRTLRSIHISFDPFSDLSEEQELELIELLEEKSGFGDEESDAFEDVLNTMAIQAR